MIPDMIIHDQLSFRPLKSIIVTFRAGTQPVQQTH